MNVVLPGFLNSDRQNLMFADNERRWRQCLSKNRYGSWASAEQTARDLTQRGRGLAFAYRCRRYCGQWHVGHPPRVAFAPINDPSRARWTG